MRLSTNTPNPVENMSDDNLDIDIEESDDDDSDTKQARNKDGTQFYSQAEKRAHHNALERKRRDHIKDSFTSLRDSVPSLQGEKASRAQILKKAAEYIQFMRRKNNSHQQDIDDLKRQNSLLEAQSTSLLRTLERARSSGNFADGNDMATNGGDMKSDTEEDESSEGDDDVPQNVSRNKKIKTNSYVG